MVCYSIVCTFEKYFGKNNCGTNFSSFLIDSLEPGVWLSTGSPNFTKESNINVVVEFTKPVFGFEASMVKVNGGKITRQVHLVILNPCNNHINI